MFIGVSFAQKMLAIFVEIAYTFYRYKKQPNAESNMCLLLLAGRKRTARTIVETKHTAMVSAVFDSRKETPDEKES